MGAVPQLELSGPAQSPALREDVALLNVERFSYATPHAGAGYVAGLDAAYDGSMNFSDGGEVGLPPSPLTAQKLNLSDWVDRHIVGCHDDQH